MSGPSSRGQTNIDFVVGISVFLVTTLFVAGFVPEMLASYDDQASPAAVDRVADELVDDLLAASGPDAAPGVLNESCTVAFLTQSGGGGCGFDTSQAVTEQVGLGGTYQVNVSLVWNVTGSPDTEILCYDDGNESVEACGTDPLTVGPPVPEDDRSVAAASRTVTIDDRLASIEVRVW